MIGIIMNHQVPPIIIVENNINWIINLLIITNVNSIVIIKQQNKLLTQMWNIGKMNNGSRIHHIIQTPNMKKFQLFPLIMNSSIIIIIQHFLLVVLWLQKTPRCMKISHRPSRHKIQGINLFLSRHFTLFIFKWNVSYCYKQCRINKIWVEQYGKITKKTFL